MNYDMKITISGRMGVGKTVMLDLIADTLREAGMRVYCEDGGMPKHNPAYLPYSNLFQVEVVMSGEVEERSVLITTEDGQS